MKKYYLSMVVFGLLWSTVALAGGEDKDERVKAKHRRVAEEAEFFWSIDDHFMSNRIYGDLVEWYPDNAEFNFRLGFTFLHLRNQESEGISFLEHSAELDYTPALYFLAEAYHMEQRFDEALTVLEDYRTRPDRNLPYARVEIAMERIMKAKDYLSEPIDARIQRLGSNVNTEHQDYAPNIDPEGKYLYFTSRRPESTGGYTDMEGNYFEDIFMSHCINGAWTSAEPVARPLNSDGHDANVNFSASGNKMLIYRTHKNLYSGDLYYSERSKGNWTEPIKLSDRVNTNEFHEPSAAFSTDEREIYVVSDRPGGFGGKDIYIIRMLPNGEWSEPENLGMEVNSSFDEDAPFVSLDGRTLYFSSNGNGSIGGYDIFRTTRSDLGQWSTPDHLGYPINSVHDDIYFSLTADAKRGFLSSSRDGNMDIYEVDMLFEEQDMVVAKGLVTEKENGMPVAARLTFVDQSAPSFKVSTVTNVETGKYVVALRPGTIYEVISEAIGFEEKRTNIQVDVDEKGDFTVVELNITLQNL